MRIYLSGPISGVKDYKDAFDEVERRLSRKYQGATIYNPAKAHAEPLCGKREKTWQEWMQMWIALIVETRPDIGVMLPGWRESKGAVIERTILQIFGARIIDMEKEQEG